MMDEFLADDEFGVYRGFERFWYERIEEKVFPDIDYNIVAMYDFTRTHLPNPAGDLYNPINKDPTQ